MWWLWLSEFWGWLPIGFEDFADTGLVFRLLTFLGNSEQLKPGGAIPEKGKKITLSVKNITDLSRDVIKVSFLLQFVYFL